MLEDFTELSVFASTALVEKYVVIIVTVTEVIPGGGNMVVFRLVVATVLNVVNVVVSVFGFLVVVSVLADIEFKVSVFSFFRVISVVTVVEVIVTGCVLMTVMVVVWT